MQLKSLESRGASAVTIAIRPARRRVGSEHVYELNGSLLRDVLVDGRWLTVQATAPSAS